MTKILKYVLAVLIFSGHGSMLYGQNQALSVINGRIENGAGTNIRLVYKKIPFINQPLEMAAKADSSGKFSLVFPLERRSSLELVTGNNSITLLISPGDTLHMSIQLRDTVGNYVFSGEAGQESYLNYLNFIHFERKKVSEFQEIVKTQEPQQFKSTIDQWIKEYRKINDENLKRIKADNRLKEHSQAILKVKEATYHLIYASFQRSASGGNYTLPPEIRTLVSHPSLISLDYTASPEYQSFITFHLMQTALLNNTGGVPCATLQAYARYTDSVYAQNSRAFLMARIIGEAFESDCYSEIKPFYDAYIQNPVFPEYAEFLKTKASSRISLEPGKPAPDFDFVDAKGNTHRLEELRGKVIYLDFWATWCGPCIRAMRSAEPLKASLKDNPDIAFVYISTDQDQQKWKNHGITNNGEKNHWHMGSSAYEASMAYKVTSIPRYVIIDKEGNIVNANAPRPDSPGLEELLRSLAEKQ